MKTTTIRFGSIKTAQRFAAAARRRGYDVTRSANDVTVSAPRHKAEAVIREWATNRGGLPGYTVIDWT